MKNNQKIKKNKKNIGLLYTYNFHNGRQPEQKMNLEIMEYWYPNDIKKQEYFILKRIYELANEKDSSPIQFNRGKNDENVAALYMTLDTPLLKSEEDIFYNTSQDIIRESLNRAIHRFDDLKLQGYVGGNIYNPFITMTGVKHISDGLKEPISIEPILISINQLKECFKSESLNITTQLDTIINNMKKEPSPITCIESINSISTLGGNALNTASFVIKIINYISQLL